MNIVISVPSVTYLQAYLLSQFYFPLIKELARQQPQHRFFVSSDNWMTNSYQFPANTTIISGASVSGQTILSLIRRQIQLQGILKKNKADLFLSLDGDCLKRIDVPQCILLTSVQKLSSSCIKRANSLAVLTMAAKSEISGRYHISDEKIIEIHVAAHDAFQPIGYAEKEEVKKSYTNSNDFFLYNSLQSTQDDFIILLKAFSGFKKRQKSSLKLVVLSPNDSLFEKNLLNYKYKNDVKIIKRENVIEVALITASAYASVLPGEHTLELIPALEALKCAVPIIAVCNSAIENTFSEAFLGAEKNESKEIGEKMIRLYTDEQLRVQLLEKGKSVAEGFTWSRAAGLLWQCLQRALS